MISFPFPHSRRVTAHRTPAAPAAHHLPGGGFRNPWVDIEHGFGDFLRWRLERARAPLPADPPLASLPRAAPSFDVPRAAPGACTVTWVGHSTFLVQMGALNILTDPIWSATAGPLPGVGARRLVAPGCDFDALPPIDIVLLSHNHYDHCDDATVRRLVAAHPAARWVTTLGLAAWLARRGARHVVELDWWEETDAAGARIACLPAQHFSARSPFDRWRTLWGSFAVRAGGRSVYFGGDSGYHPEFTAIGGEYGPFDLSLLPIGAYEPRWFMRPMHMDPEEAVRAFGELNAGAAPGQRPVMVAMHWGTFKLTDEPLDEPPRRARAAWARTGAAADDLWILPHGGTRRR